MSTQVVDENARAAVPGPVPGTRITEAYARLLARDAYFWAWPMANIYNKRLAFGRRPRTDRSRFTCRRTSRTIPSSAPIGCRHPRTPTSRSTCGRTGRMMRSPAASGHRQRS